MTLTFKPSDFFAFRTPLLTFQELLSWGEGLEAPAALDDPAKLEQALARDRERLRERLHIVAKRPEIRDALFVASPNIIERFNLWTEDPDSERGRKVEHVLVRYFSRMTGRATPFGLFAGCSVGTISDHTLLLIEERGRYQRHTRLDMDYLFALATDLARDQELRKLFTYRPNSSLYRAADRVRYVESRLEDKIRSYHLVAVEETDYLDATLALAKAGETFSALAQALVNDAVSLREAEDFITELIESQILVPEIFPPVTGLEPIHPLVDELRSHEKTTEFADTLDRVRMKLAEVDKAGLGVEPESYRFVAGLLGSLPAKVELSRLFQVDMIKPAREAILGGAVIDEITRGVGILHGLAQRPRQNALTQFREAFVARYEQREVPLVEALDEEVGLGFGTSGETSPLLKGVAFPPAPDETGIDPVRQTLLLRRLSEALRSGAQEISLEPRELESMSAKDQLPLPNSFAVEAIVAADSQEALAQGDFRVFLQGVAGPSGAILLGRFCHADEALLQHVVSHLRVEESFAPEAVFAEIVHLPEGRIGNVIFRPLLREYEIPYLGCSGVARDRQIPVTDLHVSVEGERVRLRSARTGREVIPRMTNAHNYAWGSLGVYKFLCMLQHQGSSAAGWDWGALRSAPFLPRVTSGRLVLSLARWRISKEELSLLGKEKGAKRFQAVQRWRADRQLPRLVALADADNVLPVDLDNALSIESFVALIKDREEATLQEIFPGPDQLCAHGPEGRFVHELIVPFVRKQKDAETRGRGDTVMMITQRMKDEGGRMKEEVLSSLHPSPFIPATSRRRFPPGSEWLYSKLYTGTATADYVLRDVVSDITEESVRTGAVDQWFFIRYGDPDWHVRLRFHGLPERLHREVFPALHAALNPLLDDGRLWRLQVDTYEREVERYGGEEGITLAERFFHVDSEVVLEMLGMLEPGDAGADERWRLTLAGIDRLLTDFGFDPKDKCAIMKLARERFGREFRVEKNVVGQLSEKFRKERQSLEELLRAEIGDHSLAPGLELFRSRSERLAPIIAELKSSEVAGRLSFPLRELVLSYIHMHANRLLRSAQRQQELVIYDLLARTYESLLARAK
ncbi:MAG: lantibiotic dehydratase [Pyrinomonadaceae bacterium]